MSLDLEACCTGSLISLVICHQDADIGEMIDWMYIPVACRWTAFGDVGFGGHISTVLAHLGQMG